MDNSHLNPDEVARYARHIVLAEIGGAGQQRLKAARVLVIGAGGLGSPVLSYLAAAGVGLLGVIDDDVVSLSNLQRQILHDTDTVGMAKTKSAERALKRLNPHTQVVTHEMRLTTDNAIDILTGYDMVVDGSDSFETRYLLADSCEALKIPLVTAAVGRFDGSITVLTPYETGDDGKPCPRYRDLFPEAPPPGLVPSCAEAGVIGALTGVIGTLEAMEVIKLITGAGEPLIGKLLLYDGLAASFRTVRYKRKG
ncbi:molybdopterin-synthase adenylyltransferase MoeB [uncultured Hoeflea sp.]|uniref:molybdopterin-synthase adenylyltransferase MoeB n=1 Tax=uncultured Hoeflea sp. TaxID=538666 RepID=UPI0030D7401F